MRRLGGSRHGTWRTVLRRIPVTLLFFMVLMLFSSYSFLSQLRPTHAHSPTTAAASARPGSTPRQATPRPPAKPLPPYVPPVVDLTRVDVAHVVPRLDATGGGQGAALRQPPPPGLSAELLPAWGLRPTDPPDAPYRSTYDYAANHGLAANPPTMCVRKLADGSANETAVTARIAHMNRVADAEVVVVIPSARRFLPHTEAHQFPGYFEFSGSMGGFVLKRMRSVVRVCARRS